MLIFNKLGKVVGCIFEKDNMLLITFPMSTKSLGRKDSIQYDKIGTKGGG